MRSVTLAILIYLSILLPPTVLGHAHFRHPVKLEPSPHDFGLTLYPEEVPLYPVRSDPHNASSPVSRGKFIHHWNNALPTYEFHRPESLTPKEKKLSVKELQDLLQCSPDEPGLNQHGTFSMLRMIQPTRETIEILCAFEENRGCGTWNECRSFAEGHKNGSRNFPSADNFPEQFTGYYLVRVANGSLFIDWPWGRNRFYDPTSPKHSKALHVQLLQMVLDMTHDIPDSVFFFGSESIGLHQWNHPFPNVAFSPTRTNNMIPFPWHNEVWNAYRFYMKLLKELNANRMTGTTTETEITDTMIDNSLDNLPWSERKSKAALYATFFDIRQIMFDEMRVYPDLFDMSLDRGDENINPWNPISQEGIQEFKSMSKEKAIGSFASDPLGFASPLLAFDQQKSYNPGHYKYVVVPLAFEGGVSSSGRLLWLLAYSGAVILLQEGLPTYHITNRLKPWIHYVPLSVSGADLAQKVQWLKDHEDMAKQIAINGRNFGKSYLRLEDYYCYAAKMLTAFGTIYEGSDALQSFDPAEIMFVNPIDLNESNSL